MTATKSFQANVRRNMELMGMTQKELAAQVGLTETSVSRILKGYSSPSLTTCDKIATALNVQVASLFMPLSEKNQIAG